MKMKLTFDSTKPITGEASIIIDTSPQQVFCFVAEKFFENYRKWAPEVIELKALDGNQVFVGARGKQVREDSNTLVESTFEISEYDPYEKFVSKVLIHRIKTPT